MYNMTEDPASITIRPAFPDDAEALRRLAERDSKALPDGELLVAMVGDEARAAVSVETGGVIADPFHPTAELVAMLRVRGSRLRGETGRTGSAALRPQPVG
jgi:hypothetical protein